MKPCVEYVECRYHLPIIPLRKLNVNRGNKKTSGAHGSCQYLSTHSGKCNTNAFNFPLRNQCFCEWSCSYHFYSFSTVEATIKHNQQTKKALLLIINSKTKMKALLLTHSLSLFSPQRQLNCISHHSHELKHRSMFSDGITNKK